MNTTLIVKGSSSLFPVGLSGKAARLRGSSVTALPLSEQHSRLSPPLGAGPSAMAAITCRVQHLEDSDPFICTNFPEPRRPPTVNVEQNIPLSEQISGIHKLLQAPLKVSPPWLPAAGVFTWTRAGVHTTQ